MRIAASPGWPGAPAAPGAPARLRATPVRFAAERIGFWLFAAFIFFTCFTFLRPSPYDFTAVPAMAVWLALGIRLHRAALLFVLLLLLYHLGLIAGLLPYLAETGPTEWTFQSLYLMVTCVFFVMFFSDDAERRAEFAFKAYLASCLFAAAAGIVSYAWDNSVFFVMDGRAAGVFEDPNVLGSFLVLGVLYLLRRLLTGTARHPLLEGAAALVVVVAIVLSFSRGSFASLVVGSLLMTGLTFRSSAAAIRRRIAKAGAAVLLGGCLALAGLLSIDAVGDTFSDRATLTKDYDEGVTGRFGNQLRSLPMLVERPEGFGPRRFRVFFGLEPHNSYIGGFANGGWLGGLAFFGMVLTTVFVGFRLCLRASPFQAAAQVVFPATLMFFLQAVQIDIDHWRHVYMMIGMVWGLECARVRWERTARTGAAAGFGAGSARAAFGGVLVPTRVGLGAPGS